MFDFGNDLAVKICGVTNVEDAEACARFGAEMIGLNFSPQSPRCLSLAQANEIIAAARAHRSEVKFIGVFVNQEASFIEKVARHLVLDAVQLHGEETPADLERLRAPAVIKAFRVGPDFSAARVSDYDCAGILLDGWSASLPGGTGKTFPWSIAAKVQPFVRRLFLAGGLTAENLAEALKVVRPFALDVCSGVEARPGQKDHEKIRRFIEIARATNAANV